MFEASYYEVIKPDDSVAANKVRCHICPHNCLIAPDKTGICRQRKNISGRLYLINYGKVTSVNLDPIEKKPLYHFHPASQIISFGTNGCNLSCMFCQNWSISQEDAGTEDISPRDAIKIAQQHKSNGIAYTYNEPLMWYEFVRDCAKLAREANLKNVLVTNGFINPEPFAELLPYIDALNIDIKSIHPEFYKKLCKARLEPVLETAKTAKKKAHVEITNLIIPEENDTEDDFRKISEWVAENLGKDTPLHFSAYYPTYKLNNPPTPPSTLQKAYEIGRKYLDYVYLGNVSVEKGRDTFCVKCRTKLIQRIGYNVKILRLAKDSSNVSPKGGGRCGNCGAENNIIL
ncbi:MAG: AmmeMemoRadiSam system radical SAM enzyme [Planctomycetes bacterium]|nr:AmmeMemoRadiSam system radical SAM enzyme [Planctomycetota bacterium]